MLVSELIRRFKLEPASPLARDFEIRGVQPLGRAGAGDLSFLTNPKYKGEALATKASAILIEKPLEGVAAVQLLCGAPYLALAEILQALYPDPAPSAFRHASAVIHPSAEIGADCAIGPHCTIEANASIGARTRLAAGVYIGADCAVGEDCVLHPNVVLYPGVRLGARVRLHANVAVGADGFGYAQDGRGRHVKVPQIGGVRIEDDVEVGANAAIDRGALDDTVIGKGAKIDNLVQVAHGVKVGEHAMLISQTGVSGSAEIGAHTVLAGKVGVVGHVSIGDRIVVMGDAVVTKNLDKPGYYAGNPAEPHIQYQRRLAHLRQLPDLKRRVKALERALDKERANHERHDD